MKELNALVKKLKLPASWSGMQPARDWLIILALSCIALVVSVVWNVSFFTSALNDQAAPEEAMAPAGESSSALPALEALFEKQRAQADRYEGAVFVDPSL